MIICAHNSVAGGSVQVSTSLISLYVSQKNIVSEIKAIYVSPQVHHNLVDLGIESSKIHIVSSKNFLKRLFFDTLLSLKHSKSAPIFYIFGPSYSLVPSFFVKQCAGVAGPWVLFDASSIPSLKSLPFFKFSFFYRCLKLFFFKNNHLFWTESAYASANLLNLLRSRSTPPVITINNHPNALFFQSSSDTLKSCVIKKDVAVIGYPHVHKNILSSLFVLRDLLHLGLDSTFHFTMPYDLQITQKFNSLSSDLGVSKYVHNHGFVSVSKCREIYLSCSISYHPSLLEVASVSPLEAVLCNCELVMPSLPFNKYYSEYAYLYEPYATSREIAALINDIVSSLNPLMTRSSKLMPSIHQSASLWSSKHCNLFHKMNQI